MQIIYSIINSKIYNNVLIYLYYIILKCFNAKDFLSNVMLVIIYEYHIHRKHK